MVPKWSKSDLSCSKWSKNADKWPRSIIFKKWAKICQIIVQKQSKSFQMLFTNDLKWPKSDSK